MEYDDKDAAYNADKEYQDFGAFSLPKRMKYLGKFAVVACMDRQLNSLVFKSGTVTDISPYYIEVSGVEFKEFCTHIYFLGDTREDVINAATAYYDQHLGKCYNKDGWFSVDAFMDEIGDKFPKYTNCIFVVS